MGAVDNLLCDASLTLLELTSLPEVTGLAELRKLDLSVNKLKSFPDVSKLTRLSWVELGHNLFTTVPKEICNIQNLEVRSSSLSFLFVSHLLQCKVLNLFRNKLTSIAPEIGQLTRLKKLYLSYNQLHNNSLPDTMSKLTSLEELFLSGNQFSVVPEVVCKISSLTELCFSNCQLEKVAGIGDLIHLQHLHLNCNYLKSLPKEFGQLSELVEVCAVLFRSVGFV